MHDVQVAPAGASLLNQINSRLAGCEVGRCHDTEGQADVEGKERS